MPLPASALIFICFVVLFAYVVAERRYRISHSYRAHEWKEDERLKKQHPGYKEQKERWHEHVGKPVLPAKCAEESLVLDLQKRFSQSFMWQQYERTNPSQAKALNRKGWVVGALILAPVGLLLLLALTPLKSIGGMLALFFGAGASRAIFRARREALPHQASARLRELTDDARSPVLLLRSFDHDHHQFGDLALLDSLETNKPTVELSICDASRKLGPVYAIGKPSDHLPQGDAVKLFVSDDWWKEVVSYCMARSAHTVLRAGQTASLRWELSEIIRLGLLPRCTIVLVDHNGYPYSRQNYEEFAELMREVTGVTLPECGWTSWFVYFDGQFVCRACPSSRPWLGAAEFPRQLARHLVRTV